MTGRRSPRMLVAVCAAMALAAAALWAASASTWVRVQPPGRAPVEVAGAVLAPALTGIALLALAGVAGAVAVAGLPRRLLGVLLVGAAVWVVVLLGPLLSGDPLSAAAAVTLPTGVEVATLRGSPATVSPAPLLAVAGALVLAASGIALLVGEPRLPRFGARYAATGRSRAVQDPDRQAWEDLDDGRDPTAETGSGRGTGRGDDS